MIARCPGCQTRYRLAPEKIGPRGARIRCSRCDRIFRVEAPSETEAAPKKPSLATALVAEADSETAKAISGYLERWRIEAIVVEDGGQALLRMTRDRPSLVILGGHLPGLPAAAIAEIAKRMTDLQDIPLVRAAAPGEPVGAPEFEADHTLEPGDLPGALGPILEELGVGEQPSPEQAPPPPQPPPKASPSPAPRRGAPEGTAAGTPASADPEVAAAERLARIVVSDIILYNEEKFAQGVQRGNVAQQLSAELEEASALFKQRVPEKLRARRNFLVEELERRAAKRRESN